MFNGSANDYDGISLNSLLHSGPNLFPDLAELLIHWMNYQYVFVSDIKQMLRQILIHPDDKNTNKFYGVKIAMIRFRLIL